MTLPTRHRGVSASAAPGPVWLDRPFGQRETAPELGSEVEKQASSTIRPAKNGWSRSIPVSRMATVVPAPVQPAALATSDPITLVLESRKVWLSESGYTDLTRGSFLNPARVALSTSATKKCGDRVASSTLAVAEIFSTSPATVLTLSPGFEFDDRAHLLPAGELGEQRRG